MRTMFLMFILSLASVVTFAQGKIGFQNDSLHLAFYGYTDGPDAGLQGQAIDSAHMPIGLTMVAGLYAGTSSSLLSLISTTTFGAVPGKWNATSVTIPGAPGGSTVFVAVQIRNQSAPPPTTFTGTFYGGAGP